MGVPDEPQFAPPPHVPNLQTNVLGGPSTLTSAFTTLTALPQSIDHMAPLAPFAPQTDRHDGYSGPTSGMDPSHSVTNLEYQENESANLSLQTDTLPSPVAVYTSSTLQQDFDQMIPFAFQTNSYDGNPGLALDMYTSHSITNSSIQENESANLELQTDTLLSPTAIPTLSTLQRDYDHKTPFAPHIAIFGESSALALQRYPSHTISKQGAQDTRFGNHGLRIDAIHGHFDLAALNPLHQNFDQTGPFENHMNFSGESSGLTIQDEHTYSLTDPATSDTRYGNHGLQTDALLGPSTLLTLCPLHQNLVQMGPFANLLNLSGESSLQNDQSHSPTNVETSDNRVDNYGLRGNAVLDPHAALPTPSPSHQYLDQMPSFVFPMKFSEGSSRLALQSDQFISFMNPVATDTQLGNPHKTRQSIPTPTQHRQEQTQGLEERSTDLLPIYDPARAQHIAILSSHGLVSRNSVSQLADLQYATDAHDNRYIQEELFAPGAEYGNLPDYSRVQRKLLLAQEHEPPPELYSERSSILDTESEGSDSFDGLLHQDGLLPQPVRHSQISMRDRSLSNESREQSFFANFAVPSTAGHAGPPKSPLSDASFSNWAPEFMARVQSWIDGIIPFSIAEVVEAEYVCHDFATIHIMENAENVLTENNPFIISGQNALASALETFHRPSQQLQDTSSDVTEAEIERNRARALQILTRGPEPSMQAENLFSESEAMGEQGPEQALERLHGRLPTRLQMHADTQRLQEANRSTVFENFVDNCREFIVYQLGTVEGVPTLYTYRHGSEYVRQRLQEHFGDERIGYAMEVFQQIMETHNPSVSIDEDNIYASWRYDYAHRNDDLSDLATPRGMLIPPQPHRNLPRNAAKEPSENRPPPPSTLKKKKTLGFLSLFSRKKKHSERPSLTTPNLAHYSDEARNVTQRLGSVARRSLMDAIAWPYPPPGARNLERSESLPVVRDLNAAHGN
ncbi:hypothetical protein MMC30_003712 [Trapelia coarctata]|nr:hypothetical protein [Trapelia coarctata]